MESSRGFDATELRLGLPGFDAPTEAPRGGKRPNVEEIHREHAVGWPPVKSYRKNSFQGMRKTMKKDDDCVFVKVAMDGAPYLRKIDLNVYEGYDELKMVLKGMFNCFTLGEGCDGQGYVMVFQDKDGDWMMVGDVPWEMFITSCKRLRIMKESLARGAALGLRFI
ncbi:hypothetical protein HPP92_025183 [Vanilla planifolia]|uniref:Auxin-responsive protein n=1 Tax=Vanilla planifolia TaxID=51239 RepID=A0A835U8S1_VANPL|nr:hypothetical protein HPP92_025183 [Vanilla planifolia]